jgi:hypothetical protein
MFHSPTVSRSRDQTATYAEHRHNSASSYAQDASQGRSSNGSAASSTSRIEHVCLLQSLRSRPMSADLSPRQNVVVASILSLPAEIRNQIYETVFQGWIFAIRRDLNGKDGYETDVWSADTNPYRVLERRSWPITDRSSNVLGLMYTCRQIHAETKHLPFGLRTILCGDRVCPSGWKDVLHPKLYHVRTLQLCTKMPANIILSRVWLEILPQFKDIKRIEIHWQLRMPAWGSEEDHLSTAAADEIDMRKRIVTATSAACEVTFHRTVVGD